MENLSNIPQKFKLSGSSLDGKEVGGFMLITTGLNHFYYVRNFTDRCCKHSGVLSIIRERLHRKPCNGDTFIVISQKGILYEGA